MATLIRSGPPARPSAGVAALVSAALHLLVAALLIRGAASPSLADLSTILPALYLYAPDRVPAAPREIRIPVPEDPGNRFGADVPVAHALPDGFVRSRPRQPRGLLPPGPPVPRIDSVFSAIAVDSEVVRYPSAVPIYPDPQLAQGVEGVVEAEFVVDTTGTVDMESIRILTSTHENFAVSVRQALAAARFRPAWRDLRKVRQLVRQRFAFRLYRPDSESVSM